MLCAIMQPTYIPWIGYFSMIDKVNKFVFLDNVQLEKRSWQVRNRIKTNNGELFLTIPVVNKKSRKKMLIYNTEINYKENWKEKHLKSLQYNYAKAPYFSEVYDFFQETIDKNTKIIGDFNIILIKRICNKIGITTEIYRSSEISNLTGKKDQLLANICKNMSCTEYLSAQGSAEYIENESPGGNIAKNGIELFYQNYEHPIYPQLGEVFIPYMGIIDLLFNTGFKNALEIIRKGNRKDIHYIDFRKNYIN